MYPFLTLVATVVAILHEELNGIKNNQVSRTVIYIVQSNGDLLLGPFQGRKTIQRLKRTDTRLPLCWRAIERKECFVTTENRDVDHPKSEIVVPIIVKGKPTGVLYLDSSYISAFNDKDREILTQVANLLANHWPTPQPPRALIQSINPWNTKMLWLLFPTSCILYLLFRTSFKPLLPYY